MSSTTALIDRTWVDRAIGILRADAASSAETPLIRVSVESIDGIDVFLKDESAHPTGSLKHRLARELLLSAICNGYAGQDTQLVEASSGSTAVSEAYFAGKLGLR